MKERNIVKIDNGLKNWVTTECFEEADFRDLLKWVAMRNIECNVSDDLKFVYTAFGETFEDIKSAIAFVIEHMLKAMQFLHAWSHMSDEEFRVFCVEWHELTVDDNHGIAQKN